ncbi:MAG: acyl-CoA reductase [Salegentibacter sp.]
MTIEERKKYFIEVGKFLRQFRLDSAETIKKEPENQGFLNEMNQKIDSAVHHNGWFTRENVVFALQQWSKALTKENLDAWLGRYEIPEIDPKTVGIVMAGNIPLVGFHDFLSVLMSGHNVLIKQSGNDKQLLPVIAAYLMNLDPEFEEKISFTEEKLENFDAVIATGSNNTARYFEYYFGNKPHIIRRNRNSVAVLDGNESPEELDALGEDIFRYYGLGCRNVSKLYVPKGYDFTPFFEAMYGWNAIINQAKYANNYDYNKAVYLMSEFRLLENGFLILKEDSSFGSPIATLFYETYEDEESLKQTLEAEKERLQCVVSRDLLPKEVGFGQTQKPELWDYADDVDTMEFLLKL